jgi:type I restriction enzyme S subunit
MWVEDTDERITREALEQTTARLFPAGTVLLAMYGSIGTCSIASVPLSTNQAILGCECGERVEPTYLWFWFQSIRSHLTGLGRGGTQANVNAEIVRNLMVPLPPLAEQRRIAARLTEQFATVERARKAAEARLAATRHLESAELERSFLGITPLAADRVRDNPPSGWQWRKLTDVARLESGHTPSRYHPEWWGGSVPWIALPDIRALDGKVAYDTIEHTNEAGIANSSARICRQARWCCREPHRWGL